MSKNGLGIMRGLKNFAEEVETLVREKFSSQEGGASAQEATSSQGCGEVGGHDRHVSAEQSAVASIADS